MVINAIDRSQAMVLVFILFFVWLCVFYGPFHVDSCSALCSRVFQIKFRNEIL